MRYKIEDIGMKYNDEFQGAGICDTLTWDAVFTGTGDSAKEALDDAMVAASEQGWNVELIDDILSDYCPAMDDDQLYYVNLYLGNRHVIGNKSEARERTIRSGTHISAHQTDLEHRF